MEPNNPNIKIEGWNIREFLVRAEDAYIHNNPLELNRREFLIKLLTHNFGRPVVSVNAIISLLHPRMVGYASDIDQVELATAIHNLLTRNQP